MTDPIYKMLYSKILQELHNARGHHMCPNTVPRTCGVEAADDIMNLVDKLIEDGYRG